MTIREVSDAYLETQYKVLSSEDLALRVITQLNLDHVPEFRPRKRLWLWTANPSPAAQTIPVEASVNESDPSIQQTALTRFEDRLDVKPIRRSRAVEISFDSQDPNLAARVVNALTSNYIDKNLEARWDATQKASEWLSQQMQDLKGKLEKSEDELQKYAVDNDLLILETDKGNSENVVNQSLRELQEELTKTQSARYEKESLYRLVRSSDSGSLPGVFENKLLQDLSVRLAELQREHAQLAATFTEDYPKVQQVHSQIVEIQAALERERQRAAQRITNDYYAAVSREALVQRAFADKQKQANIIAEKSVQYGILNREVESNKSMYEGLLQRLKEAGVSAGLKASNIRIVDKAKPPYKPVSPKVPLNLGLAAFLGLGLGVCAAFFQEHVDQAIENVADVDRFLGLPALAFIPTLKSLNGHPVIGHTHREHCLTLGLTSTRNPPDQTMAHCVSRNDLASREKVDLSEAFSGLRTSVLLSSSGHSASSILVTSAQPGEGKTTIAANLSISLAQLGRRVLLMPHFFGISRAYLRTCLNSDMVFVRGMCPYIGVLYLCAFLFQRPICHWIVGNPVALLRTSGRRGRLLDTLAILYALQDRLASRVGRWLTNGAFLCNGRELAEVYRSPRTATIVSSAIRESEFVRRSDTCQGATIRILFVGYLRPEKGIEYLLDAVSRLTIPQP